MQDVLPDFSSVKPDITRENVKEMLTVTESAGQTTVKINSSSLGIILACPRKSYYVLHRGLKSRTEAPALVFGTAIHKGLEVFYGEPTANRNIPEKFKEHTDLMAFGHPAPNDHFLYRAVAAFIEKAEPLRSLPDADKRSIPNGIWILQEYFKTYITDPYEVFCDTNGPVTERTAEAVIHEDPKLKVVVFGTIDLVLQDKRKGSVLPADHKTTSRLGSDFFNRLKPNHQYSGYILLAQQVLGLDTQEFLVNALEVKARPKTARGKDVSFARQITSRSPADMAEFKDAVMWAVRSYLSWLDTSVWPLGHVNECTSYGACQFLDVCGAPSQLRENLIEAKFSEQTS